MLLVALEILLLRETTKMAHRKIPVQIKTNKLTLGDLNAFVGAVVGTNPDASELIVICRSATRDAKNAIGNYPFKIKIVEKEF
ncbi:hypothetical protein JOY44_01855 [Phormidium sp. CLA17]|uniref:hypothetical protein n=1 Tax=Leptolyngbya sp. Cla-17 TaxID=2803751 RepID=UPI001931A8EA|nr:hypothetical protein [Leptolyngbya sp. Cla-17]MBM0740371.1 hypothetical protein [Leptolyngbya sp. Cla-17]